MQLTLKEGGAEDAVLMEYILISVQAWASLLSKKGIIMFCFEGSFSV